MLHLFDAHASLFRSWRVVSYEQEGETYALQVTAVLRNGNHLEMRDYLFAGPDVALDQRIAQSLAVDLDLGAAGLWRSGGILDGFRHIR